MAWPLLSGLATNGVKGMNRAAGLGAGLAIGVGLGIALDNLPLGFGVGVVLGIALGAGGKKRNGNRKKDD